MTRLQVNASAQHRRVKRRHYEGQRHRPSSQRNDIDPKLLQFTKELLPDLKRLCLVFDGRRERNLVDYANNELRALAKDIGVSVCMIPIRTLDDIQAMPSAIHRERPQES
jgi:ABC-type uncharacterized transport system substrate-binding protein